MLAVVLTLAAAQQANAQSSDTSAIRFGGFLDAYYAFDFNRPAEHDRAFTTQAARHNEFNINLASLAGVLDGRRLRGRIAIQFGTSVQANYASEPHIGKISGPDVSRFLQEAVVGYRFGRVWIDAGVFLAAFGSENWESRNNWTYTRSMIAENSPYYETGVKATWRVSRRLSAQAHLINGWQNVSENNSTKALGIRIDYAPSAKTEFAYDAFLGDEAADSLPSALRMWHETIVTLFPASRFRIRGTLDYGQQKKQPTGSSSWWGYAIVARYAISDKVAVAMRGEQYADPDQVILATSRSYGFPASGWSINSDVAAARQALLRVEFRELTGKDPLFPSDQNLVRRDRMAVVSVALSF